MSSDTKTPGYWWATVDLAGDLQSCEVVFCNHGTDLCIFIGLIDPEFGQYSCVIGGKFGETSLAFRGMVGDYP